MSIMTRINGEQRLAQASALRVDSVRRHQVAAATGTQMMILHSLVPLLALAALCQAQVGPLQDDPPLT